MNSDKLLKALKKAASAIDAEQERLQSIADNLDEVINEVEEENRERVQAILKKTLGIGEDTPAEKRLAEAEKLLRKANVRYSIAARESDSTERTSLSYYWAISLRVGPRTTRRINATVPKSVLHSLEALADEDDLFSRWDREFDTTLKTYVFRFDREEKVTRRRVEKAHDEALKEGRERRRLAR